MIRKILLIISITVGLLIPGCSAEPQEPGFLEGKVTIGPLVPVERPGVKYEVPCEVYQARKIMVYDRNHDKLVKEVEIDCEGGFHAELEPGFYVVDINRIGIDSSFELPAEVEIRSGETVRMEIDIDTGIR
jgi:hypothetical protein